MSHLLRETSHCGKASEVPNTVAATVLMLALWDEVLSGNIQKFAFRAAKISN
jgi:hypothetical protein